MENLKEKIKTVYSDVIKHPDKSSASCCSGASSSNSSPCCTPLDDFTGFQEDYSQLPGYNPDADFGLGCGIPVAFAGIKEGQTVLDLGSGAGNDVFVARSLVGEKGKVIGVDMTPAMIELANKNKAKLGFENVDFLLGDIEELKIDPASVDVVISNCVLNLVSDKLKTYEGVYKVLKDDGHFCISDVVLSAPLTEKIKGLAELYAGCISGAMVKEDYLNTIKKAGFKDIAIKAEKTVYLPDSFLRQHLNEEALIEYRSTGAQVLSITVNGKK